MADSPVVMVKFRRAEDPTVQEAFLRKQLGKRLIHARQVFPGDAEEDLATLFEVVVRDGRQLAQLIARLESDEKVEYAHEPPGPKPMRSS